MRRWILAAAVVTVSMGHGWARAAAPEPGTPAATTRPERAVGKIDAHLNDDGSYDVTEAATGWKFAGRLAGLVTRRRATNGSDRLGAYTGIAFETADGAGPIAGEIRTYAGRSTVWFGWSVPAGRPAPKGAFPDVSVPEGLHTFSYGDSTFADPVFRGRNGGTPWLLFDNDGRAVILSPSTNYMSADVRKSDTGVASGLLEGMADLPAGYAHGSVLTFGNTIADAWATWGRALTDLTGKRRPANDADVGLAKLGYWTDNGGAYYYNFDPALGYAGTIKDVADRLQRGGVAIGYMQLDSWWYRKSTTTADGKPGAPVKTFKYPPADWNCYGGTMAYEASPALFPDGLAAWQRTLGLPLITHGRWIDPASPYHEKYRITGIAPTDPKYWDDRAEYLSKQGVTTYEQDWLVDIYKRSPQLGTTPALADTFTDGMAKATAARGMTMQYCMPTPRFYLEGTRYDNLTTVRVSDDRFQRSDWNHALYVSQLAASLGEWPFNDCFRSYETPNLILSDLSAGMVGFADSINEVDTDNLARIARADGVLVKPDTAIVPLGRTYLSDATAEQREPMVAAAYTDHGSLRTAYVFSFPRSGKRQSKIAFRPAELGIAGDAWVYEPATGFGHRVTAGDTFTDAFADYAQPWSYYVVAPVVGGHVALLGDLGKVASMGHQRIASAKAMPTGVEVDVTFGGNERSVTLHGYADAAPTVAALDGSTGPVAFNPTTHEFTFAVSLPQPINTGTVHVTVAGSR